MKKYTFLELFITITLLSAYIGVTYIIILYVLEIL